MALIDPPITLIGGFLGAGKTTAITTLLQNRRGLKIAVLVNDLADVNIDASTLQNAVRNEEGVDAIELSNGCLCCGSGAKGLSPTISGLRDRNFDHIVVELSGVADPENVRASLRTEGLAVSRTVTLIDAEAFPQNFHTLDIIAERSTLLSEVFASRAALSVDGPVVELLLRGVETADTLLINKCDVASDEAVRETLATCRALNGGAQLVTTQFGAVDEVDVLLPRLSAKNSALSCQPCERPMSADSGSSGARTSTTTESMGFSSFVYRARRPFIVSRLSALLEQWALPRKVFLGDEASTNVPLDSDSGDSSDSSRGDAASGSPFAHVIRSKGVTWLDDHPEQVVTWSHAGLQLSLEAEQCWWAMLPEESMRDIFISQGGDGASVFEDGSSNGAARYRAHRLAFDGPDGDRRQEIVFIGTRFDEAAIRAALDACLASGEEFDAYHARWAEREPSVDTWRSAEYLRRVAL